MVTLILGYPVRFFSWEAVRRMLLDADHAAIYAEAEAFELHHCRIGKITLKTNG